MGRPLDEAALAAMALVVGVLPSNILVLILSIRLDQAPFLTQALFSLTSAFAVSMSILIIATMATFAGFPASRSNCLNSGSCFAIILACFEHRIYDG